MILAILILVALLFALAVASLVATYVEYIPKSQRSQEEPIEEEEVDEHINVPLELRSPFEIGERVLIGNPHLREFTHYTDEELCKPKSFAIERAVYDASEDLFRYKLEGLPGFYSQGWLAPDMYGEEVKFYPQLDEPAPEVDESTTSQDYSKEVYESITALVIDRALDILNSDASEEEKEYARKVLRGESE